MSLILRDYQLADMEDIRGHIRAGHKAVLWQLPTGGGKTAGAATMAGNSSGKGHRVWFVCHRRELLRQTSRAFDAAGIEHGMIAAGAPYQYKKLVHVCGIDTLRRRLHLVDPPDLIIWDECHHLGAVSWKKVFEKYPKAYHIGLSATPHRLDGKGLGEFFTAMVIGPSAAELIERGYLSPYRLFAAPSAPDTSSMHMVAGDFNKKEVVDAMSKPKIIGDAIEHYLKLANGRSTLLFAPSIEFSQMMAKRFMDAGIPAAHVDGTTDDLLRRVAIRDLERGIVKVLCNVDLFGEGVSVDNVACIIQMRPTASLTLNLQQIGRGLRTFPGKTDCIILDHGSNVLRHGMPCESRQWSLDGMEKSSRKTTESAASVRVCTSCFSACRAGTPVCPNCSTVFPLKARKVEEAEGELEEVKARVVKPEHKEQGRAQSIEALIALARMRGYRAPEIWAAHVYNGRKKVRGVA